MLILVQHARSRSGFGKIYIEGGTSTASLIIIRALRLLKTGARFDTIEWAKKVSPCELFILITSLLGKATFFTRGSLTFLEAYQLTGRVLNISVIPFDRHSPTKLLNYLTAPNCVCHFFEISSGIPYFLTLGYLVSPTCFRCRSRHIEPSDADAKRQNRQVAALELGRTI